MKTTDLQIGDWYTNSDGDICKVVKNLGNIVWGQGDDVSDSTDDPNPIPLTAEILEKNGLEKTLIDEEYCYSLVTMDYVIVIRTNRDGYWKYDSVREVGRGVVIQRKFDYVHQLQQALRLCGLNDLADNFKV